MRKEKNIVCLQKEKIRLKQKERSKSGQTLHAIQIQKHNVVHNGMVMKSHSVIGKQKVPRIFLIGLMKLVLRTICPLNSMNSGGFIPTMTNLTKSWFIRTTRKFNEVEE